MTYPFDPNDPRRMPGFAERYADCKQNREAWDQMRREGHTVCSLITHQQFAEILLDEQRARDRCSYDHTIKIGGERP